LHTPTLAGNTYNIFKDCDAKAVRLGYGNIYRANDPVSCRRFLLKLYLQMTLEDYVVTAKVGFITRSHYLLDSLENKGLGHVFPRYYRDKNWETDDLDDVDIVEDGSL
jgi:hypothetical protein